MSPIYYLINQKFHEVSYYKQISDIIIFTVQCKVLNANFPKNVRLHTNKIGNRYISLIGMFND